MSGKSDENREDINPAADEDVVEGHGIEEDDDDAAGVNSLTVTGCCV